MESVAKNSTLDFRSNLQPVDIKKRGFGTEYLSKIHDPFSLEELKKYIDLWQPDFRLTEIQKQEMRNASGHCAFAFKDDYPWGTVFVDGKETVVCKCTNKKCGLFTKCRSGRSAWKKDEDQIAASVPETEDWEEDCKEGKLFVESLKTDRNGIPAEEIPATAHKDQTTDEISIERGTSETKITREETSDAISGDSGHENTAVHEGGNEDRVEQSYERPTFSQWMERQGKGTNYIKFYIGSLKPADTLAHNHHLWDGELLDYPDDKALDLIQKFKNAETSGREKIIKKQLVQVLDLYGEYLKSTAYSDVQKVSETDTSGKATDGLSGEDIEAGTILVNEKGETGDEQEITPDSKESAATEHEGAIGQEIHQNNIAETITFDNFKKVTQETVIKSDVAFRIVINAGPGTGKTFTLISKIIYLISELDIDPDEILVLCFSRAAVEVIESRLEAAYREGRIGVKWHSVEIRTFDSFATSILAWTLDNEPKYLPENFQLQTMGYDERISAAVKLLKEYPEIISGCGHFIVDEVQDLVSGRAEMVRQMIMDLPEGCGYTLLGDFCQAIYDYQIQPGDLSSKGFYHWLFSTQKDAQFFSFGINYRQTSELEQIGEKYRKAILSGNKREMEEGLQSVEEKIDHLEDMDLKHPNQDNLEKLSENKTLGILTRTNGQALLISTWLRTADVPHRVQKSLTDYALNHWIADVFFEYPNDTISKSEFLDYLEKKIGFEQGICSRLWSVLVNTQKDKGRERYSIGDFLLGIKNNGRDRELYTFDGNQNIVISNIHRSKGREFDQVIILDDILNSSSQEKNDEEYKVSYVAITRAKSRLAESSIGKQYIYIDKKGDRRAYKNGFNRRGKKTFSHMEIGRIGDLDTLSMARDEQTQSLIGNIEPGERVSLKKNTAFSKEAGYVVYDVVPEKYSSGEAIARTSKKFYLDMTRIIKQVNNLPDYTQVYERVYPYEFSDIYIDDVISIVEPVRTEAKGARRYGNMMIWKGISLIGFGKTRYDVY